MTRFNTWRAEIYCRYINMFLHFTELLNSQTDQAADIPFLWKAMSSFYHFDRYNDRWPVGDFTKDATELRGRFR